MNRIRYFSHFNKLKISPSKEEIERFKKTLLNAEWKLKDDALSTYPSKQLYVTLQSLLDKKNPKFMEGFNTSKSDGVNELFRTGKRVPIGYSLAYCNPLSNESELGPDGYDNYHAPATECTQYFNRRMWVSGEFCYTKSNPLVYGDEVKFTEIVERVKVLSRAGIISADYKRSFYNQNGISLTEKRRLCYLSQLFQVNTLKKEITENPDVSITVIPSIITCFRMSALTFNSHQIHYNPEYAKNHELYPNAVVEAPLLIALSLQFWQNFSKINTASSFKYKITAPSFINEPLTINLKVYNTHAALWIVNKQSTVCFESTIQF